MSKHKKIFHKPEDKIPTTDDILNYLKEDSMDADEKLSDLKPSPSLSMASGSGIEKNVGSSNKSNTNSKKKHELEKAMLSEPLISDAVEGYALLKDKEKNKKVIFDINKSIANQTTKKNDQSIVFRIAAIFIVGLMIAGSGMFLYNQFSNNEIAEFANENSKNVSSVIIGKDSLKKSNIDSVSHLAIETEKKDINAINNLPTFTDGYINNDQMQERSNGPVSNDDKGTGTISKNSDEISSDKSINKTEVSPIPAVTRSIERETDSIMVPKDQLAIVTEEGYKEDNYYNADTKRKSSKKLKQKGESNAPSIATKSDSENLDEIQAPSGRNENTSTLQEGITLYNNKQFKEAKKVFSALLQLSPSNNDAKWYLAIINIKLGKKDEAKKLLTELSVPGNPYSEKATEELKKMN